MALHPSDPEWTPPVRADPAGFLTVPTVSHAPPSLPHLQTTGAPTHAPLPHRSPHEQSQSLPSLLFSSPNLGPGSRQGHLGPPWWPGLPRRAQGHALLPTLPCGTPTAPSTPPASWPSTPEAPALEEGRKSPQEPLWDSMCGTGHNGESAKGSGLSSNQEVLLGRKKCRGPARLEALLPH